MKLLRTLLLFLLLSGVCFAETEIVDWVGQAGFYESNYPDCNKNQKAQMLYDSMIKNGAKGVTLEKKVYKVQVYHVYYNGTQLWPTEHQTAWKPRDLSKRLRELETFFK